MKNKGIYCLILICCVCMAFTGGLFVGRNANHTHIQLSAVATVAPSAPTQESTAATQAGALININTADLAQLQTLPGIGEVLAQRIIDYRQTHGAFRSATELGNVDGIGEKTLETILDYVTVGG